MLPASPYVGPTAILENMIHRSKVENVPGLNIMIGESSLGYGLAMYLAVDEDVDACHVPKGSLICEYGAGRFVREEIGEGDKTVCFFFDTADAFVFYNGMVTPLVDCILDTIGEEAISTDYLNKILAGHSLSSSKDIIKTIPDPLYTERYYIPTETTGETIHKESLGMYANDLAYEKGTIKNEADYLSASEGDEGLNVLALMWKLVKTEVKDSSKNSNNFDREKGNSHKNKLRSSSNLQTLQPEYPVLVTQRPLLFTNTIPMEVGLHYGFKYWEKYVS